MLQLRKFWKLLRVALVPFSMGVLALESLVAPAVSAPPRSPDEIVECEILTVGGGLAGAATAYGSAVSRTNGVLDGDLPTGWGDKFHLREPRP